MQDRCPDACPDRRFNPRPDRQPSPWTRALSALAALVLAACAQVGPAPDTQGLLQDRLFAAPTAPLTAQQVFALSEPMRDFANQVLASPGAMRDRRQALFDELFKKGQLRFYYDASATRSAAETFAARTGNCISLVVMTAALAKHLGLPVTYQSVLVDDAYDRLADLFVISGHVNIVLGSPPSASVRHNDSASLTVDFLPPEEVRGHQTVPIREATVVAMYLNNRAVDALVRGQLTDAYWRAREALANDPTFAAAANTLAVVYQRAGHAGPAEVALRHVLQREPNSTTAWSNLANLLRQQGREAEANQAAQRLAQLQPNPPFWHFERGREAMQRSDFTAAREHFRRELRLQPNQHEVHFWLARAHAALGELDSAAKHLSQAAEFSPTQQARTTYSAKLQRLREAREP